MGTRRLWLAVLLALLQYAAVRAEAPPADCSSAVKPDLKCPPGYSNCVERTKPDEACTLPNKLFFLKNNDVNEKWKPITKIECVGTAAPFQWQATIIDPIPNHILTAADKVMCTLPESACAKAQKAPMHKSECPTGIDPSIGCVPKTSTPDLKCGTGLEMFIEEVDTGLWANLVSAECVDASKQWKVHATNKEYILTVDSNIVCAKTTPPRNTACIFAPVYTSACPTGTDTSIGCVEKLTGPDKKCDEGLEMFWSRGNIMPWTKLSRISCKVVDKTWRGHEKRWDYGITTADNVVCAKKEPIDCNLNQPPSKCPVNLPSSVECRAIVMDYKMNCEGAPGLELFVSDVASGTWTQTFKSVECDNTGKWTAKPIVDGGVDMPVSTANTVVCAKSDPGVTEAPPTTAFVSTAADPALTTILSAETTISVTEAPPTTAFVSTATDPALVSTATDPALTTTVSAETTPSTESGPLSIFLASIIVFAFA